MKLKKLINRPGLQVYRILNPSRNFKLKYPHNFNCILLERNSFHTSQALTIKFAAFNEIPSFYAFRELSGYIFTYKSSIPSFIASFRKYEGIDVYPICLDQYFASPHEETQSESNKSMKVDLILNISAKNKEITPRFTDDLILRCNTESLCKVDPTNDPETAKKNLINNVLKIINSIISESNITNTEDWVEHVLESPPLNNAGLPICYTNEIDDSCFTSDAKVNKSEITIGYDFRAKGYDYENAFISILEESFGNANKNIVLYDSYNGILDVVTKALDSKGYKYKKIKDFAIEVSLKNLRNLNIEYEITDFI